MTIVYYWPYNDGNIIEIGSNAIEETETIIDWCWRNAVQWLKLPEIYQYYWKPMAYYYYYVELLMTIEYDQWNENTILMQCIN